LSEDKGEEEEQKIDQPLLQKLTDACVKAKEVKFIFPESNILDALNSSFLPLSISASNKISEISSALGDHIVKDDRFPGNNTRMLRNGIYGATGFYPNFVAPVLLKLALKTDNPAGAIEKLQRVLAKTTKESGKTIRALWGVPVEREIEFTDKVKIVQFKDVPDCFQKREFSDISRFFYRSPVSTMLDAIQPQSALIVDHLIEPLTYNPNEAGKTTSDESRETEELLSDITLVLTVIGPRSALLATQWFTYDDEDLNDMLLGKMRQGTLHEILPNTPGNSFPVLDPVESREIIQRFLRLDDDLKRKLRIALQRLNQAFRRHNVGDKAVELSIAFETLLGDETNTEITHKIKVRSVRLIGGTDEIRIRNAAIMKIMYNARGNLVHAGYVDGSKIKEIDGRTMGVSEILDQAVKICADLIKIIIRSGSIPTWQTFDIIG